MKKDPIRNTGESVMETVTIIAAIVILLVTKIAPIQYGDLIGFSLLFLISLVWLCMKLILHRGPHECSVCGNIHTPTVKNLLLGLCAEQKLYTRCPKCGKVTWHERYEEDTE